TPSHSLPQPTKATANSFSQSTRAASVSWFAVNRHTASLMAESKKTVYGAIVANVAIATIKFIVAAVTGSSAMLSEGVHSLVATGNGVLLLVGIRLSHRKPSPEHPFGHGKELYFWSLIVAVLIFGVGGGLSAYEGILHIVHPTEMRDAFWNYVVLAAAA